MVELFASHIWTAHLLDPILFMRIDRIAIFLITGLLFWVRPSSYVNKFIFKFGLIYFWSLAYYTYQLVITRIATVDAAGPGSVYQILTTSIPFLLSEIIVTVVSLLLLIILAHDYMKNRAFKKAKYIKLIQPQIMIHEEEEEIE